MDITWKIRSNNVCLKTSFNSKVYGNSFIYTHIHLLHQPHFTILCPSASSFTVFDGG